MVDTLVLMDVTCDVLIRCPYSCYWYLADTLKSMLVCFLCPLFNDYLINTWMDYIHTSGAVSGTCLSLHASTWFLYKTMPVIRYKTLPCDDTDSWLLIKAYCKYMVIPLLLLVNMSLLLCVYYYPDQSIQGRFILNGKMDVLTLLKDPCFDAALCAFLMMPYWKYWHSSPTAAVLILPWNYMCVLWMMLLILDDGRCDVLVWCY